MTVGLISGLLAPVRVVMWMAEQLVAHADGQESSYRPSVPERLMEIDEALAAGEISADEAAELEEALLAQLEADSLPVVGAS